MGNSIPEKPGYLADIYIFLIYYFSPFLFLFLKTKERRNDF